MIKVITNPRLLYHGLNSGSSGTSNLHDHILDSFWLRNLVENELFLRSGGLNGHISKGEESLNESVGMHGNVLYPMVVQFRNFSIE